MAHICEDCKAGDCTECEDTNCECAHETLDDTDVEKDDVDG